MTSGKGVCRRFPAGTRLFAGKNPTNRVQCYVPDADYFRRSPTDRRSVVMYPGLMRNRALAVSVLVFASAALGMTVAQPGKRFPFSPGEELVFNVQSSRFGTVGKAVMRVTADTLRGRDVYLMAFDFSAKVLLFSASDRTRSWVDATDFT